MSSPNEAEIKNSLETWTEINIENAAANSPGQNSEPDSSCCCPCLRKSEVSEARRDLFGIVLDWVIDVAVGTLHLVRGAWIAGILTFVIVFYAGILITFTNFSPMKSRNNLAIVKSEIKKMSKFYGILMYIPSFFPICSAKLRLFYANRLQTCINCDDKIELQKKMAIFKDQALWDVCCESFFESIPQAVLQIVLLFMPNKTFTSFLDYFPIGSILFALYGITVAPITVMGVRHQDVKMGHRQRLTAYASNALKVFSCALFISAILSFTKSDDWKFEVLWTCLAAIIIFALLDGPQIFKYELTKSYPTWSRCHSFFIESLVFLGTVASFYLWVLSQILPKRQVTIMAIIVIACYSILMFFTCVGMLLYRQKLELYHSISANVLLNLYLGVKGWVCKLVHIKIQPSDPNSKSVDVDQTIPL